MTTVLITGAAGLLGSRLGDWLRANIPSYTVVGVDNLSGGFREHVNPEVAFFKLDCKDKSLGELFSTYRPEYVFHFAAYAAEGLSPFIRTYNYQNNLESTANVLNQSIKYGVRRLVFTSTMAVYGHGHGSVFDEAQIPCPIDPYGVAKYACEMDIKIAGEQHGLDWCIIRPHNVYGAKQNIWDRYRNVLAIWMYQYLHDLPLTIYGDGSQRRAFSCLDDSLLPLWNAAILPQASRQIINLGGIHHYSINEACEILRQVMGGGKVRYLEARHEVKNGIPTWQKSVDILKFSHTTNLPEGLQLMWNWAKAQPLRARFEWSEFELEKGLYSFWQLKRSSTSIDISREQPAAEPPLDPTVLEANINRPSTIRGV